MGHNVKIVEALKSDEDRWW